MPEISKEIILLEAIEKLIIYKLLRLLQLMG